MAERGVECMYALIDVEDICSVMRVEEAGFRLVDVRVTLGRTVDAIPIETSPVEASPATIRPFNPLDRDALATMARGIHTDTRFFADPRFPRSKCEDLYARWINRSCDDPTIAVLVAELDRKPAGYITCEAPPEASAGSIGLLGVSPAARGLGIGTALIRSGLQHFADAGCREVSVVTQGRNVSAQRAYQRAGFRTVRTQLWFHWWRSVEANATI
jgi:ribosomal protein S18 acetylase RimI-like enzyme